MNKNLIKVVLALFLLVCLFDMPIWYYQIVRLFGTIVFVFLAYKEHLHSRKIQAVIFGASALILNPVIKISFGRDEWEIVDIILAAIVVIDVGLSTVSLSIIKSFPKQFNYFISEVLRKILMSVGSTMFSVSFIVFIITFSLLVMSLPHNHYVEHLSVSALFTSLCLGLLLSIILILKLFIVRKENGLNVLDDDRLLVFIDDRSMLSIIYLLLFVPLFCCEITLLVIRLYLLL